VGVGRAPEEPGGAEPGEPVRRSDPPPGFNDLQRAIVGAVVGALYAVGSIARGYVAAGIVGGVLAAIVTFLALKRYAENRRRR
jgi:hypothetical protein